MEEQRYFLVYRYKDADNYIHDWLSVHQGNTNPEVLIHSYFQYAIDKLLYACLFWMEEGEIKHYRLIFGNDLARRGLDVENQFTADFFSFGYNLFDLLKPYEHKPRISLREVKELLRG